MRLRRFAAVATALVAGPTTLLAGALVVASPASASPTDDYEMPFPCGASWTGTTRSSHRPSALSIDFNRAADSGDLLVAAAAGRVSRVADTGRTSYGRYVIIDHGTGYSTLYAHLQSVWISNGQQVDQGTIVGLVGATGGVSGAHLHFEERLNGTVRHPYFHQTRYVFGRTTASLNCVDVPATGDWNGDKIDDLAVFRRGAATGTFIKQIPGGTQKVVYGRGSDTPVTGDWNGDGKSDVGVRRPAGKLFLLRNPNGSTTSVRFGLVRDVPVTGDWDGDEVSELGIWRPSTRRFRLLLEPGVTKAVYLGSSGSLPVTGDWNGDKVTDLGVFDPALGTFTLRTQAAGRAPVLSTVTFGTSTDLPVTGDWNGDGRTDVGVWTPTTATYSLRIATATGRHTKSVLSRRFGHAR